MEFALRKSSDEEVTQLSVDDLNREFKNIAASATPTDPKVWPLADHLISPPFLTALFIKIDNSDCELEGNLAVELEANCLENASVEDFKVVLGVLKKPNFARMRVRFGLEISVPTLKSALAHMDMAHLLGDRVRVYIPWVDRGVMALALEQRDANIKMEKRLKKLEKRKDPSELDDRTIEDCVAAAVAKLLGDGEVLITHYDFRSWVGGLGGLVAGRWERKDVIVLVVGKHNMDTTYEKAQSELFNALEYWDKLKASTPEELKEEPSFAADYKSMQVATYGSRSVMLAFGGSRFSKEVAQKRFKFSTPWFYVVANKTGRFSATHSGQLF